MKAALALMLMPLAALAEVPDPLTCLLSPIRSSAIGSDRGGIVARLAVARADYVEAGDLMVQLDDAIARSDLRLTEIARDAAAERLSRAESLAANSVISLDEIEAMRTELAVARAEADRAALQLSRARIAAPFAGYVAQIFTSEGQLIGPEPLLQLIDLSVLRAELVFVTEAYGTMSVGDTIPIAVDLTRARVPATITAIDPYIDASSNTFSVLAEIANPDRAIPAGASCRIAR